MPKILKWNCQPLRTTPALVLLGVVFGSALFNTTVLLAGLQGPLQGLGNTITAAAMVSLGILLSQHFAIWQLAREDEEQGSVCSAAKSDGEGD